MIKVIGNHGCSRCEITKQVLKNKNIDFDYVLLSDLTIEEQDNIMNLARECGKMALPILIKNDTIIDVKEI